MSKISSQENMWLLDQRQDQDSSCMIAYIDGDKQITSVVTHTNWVNKKLVWLPIPTELHEYQTKDRTMSSRKQLEVTRYHYGSTTITQTSNTWQWIRRITRRKPIGILDSILWTKTRTTTVGSSTPTPDDRIYGSKRSTIPDRKSVV